MDDFDKHIEYDMGTEKPRPSALSQYLIMHQWQPLFHKWHNALVNTNMDLFYMVHSLHGT